jgi:hypothetical protein
METTHQGNQIPMFSVKRRRRIVDERSRRSIDMQRHGGNRDAIDEAFDGLLKISLSEYAQKQEAFAERTSGMSRWAIDNASLTLTFDNDRGENLALSFVPIATYLPSQNSWAWVWANDAYSEQARAKASRSFPVSREEIDELCALSLRHLGAQAIFKIKDDEPWQLVAIE